MFNIDFSVLMMWNKLTMLKTKLTMLKSNFKLDGRKFFIGVLLLLKISSPSKRLANFFFQILRIDSKSSNFN